MSDNLGTFGAPNPALPIGSFVGRDGKPVSVMLNNAWFRWITRISQLSAERVIAPLSVGASPFTYTADTIGHLVVSDGTVSSRVLQRGSSSVTLTGELIPMAAGDTVTITYSVLPTVTFIPGARA